MTTDISQKGLEGLVVRAMTGRTDLLVPPHTPTTASRCRASAPTAATRSAARRGAD
jgi:hypothetical protein